jgi:hypothetical protein
MSTAPSQPNNRPDNPGWICDSMKVVCIIRTARALRGADRSVRPRRLAASARP